MNAWGKTLALAAGLVMSTALPVSANAANYVITSAGLDSTPGGLQGSVYYPDLGGGSGTEYAGVGRIQLSGTDSNGQSVSFETYCVDLFDWLGTGTFADAAPTVLNFSGDRLAKVTTFLANANPLVNDASTSAAAQLGVWEILYEAADDWDVTSGAFRAQGGNLIGSTYNSLTKANAWLGQLSSGEWTVDGHATLSLLNPQAGNQPQAYVTVSAPGAVPEPASWGLMFLGFGAIGSAMRRRRQVPVRAY